MFCSLISTDRCLVSVSERAVSGLWLLLSARVYEAWVGGNSGGNKRVVCCLQCCLTRIHIYITIIE